MQVSSVVEGMTRVLFYCLIWCTLRTDGRVIKRRCKASEIDVMSHRGAKIEPVSLSRIQLPKLSNSFSDDGHRMSFEFRTRSPSGLLFYGTKRSHHKNNIIVLQMKNGKLFFTVRCPSADVEVRLPVSQRLDDGRWHTVEFLREGRNGYITLDGKAYFRRYPVSCQVTSFVFGGLEPVDAMAVASLVLSSDHFDGCLRRLDLNVELESSPEYYAVSICS